MKSRLKTPAEFPLLVLYSVNIHQPCGANTIREYLKLAYKLDHRQLKDLGLQLSNSIRSLRKEGYVGLAGSDAYYVTLKGHSYLRANRLAFPRDKFRLYFLKDELKRRGR